MASVGERLREARESRALTLDQVEAQIHIRRAFLVAMEEDRFHDLPAGPYVRGFIRSYARFLGMAPEEVLSEYQSQTGIRMAMTPIPTILDEPLIIAPSRRSIWPVLFVSLMAALALTVVGWYGYARFYLHEDPLLVLRRSGILPESFLARDDGEQGTPGSEETPAADPTARTPSGAVGAASATRGPTEPPSPTATATREAVPTPTPRRTATPTVTPTPGPDVEQPPITGEVVVQANVTAPVWVSVTTDGVEILAATLQPGEQHTWQANDVVSLHIGNAGGLDLTVNGEPVGPLGASGEVVTRAFTREGAPGT